jgi:hypothetical protein
MKDATMTAVIPRFAPISNKAVIFLPETKENGRIDMITEGQRITVGIDYYMATEPLSAEDAKKVALAFAQHEHINPDMLVIRQRLPKTMNKRPSRLNDANLVLVQQEQPKQEAAPSSLAEFAQALQDEHNRRQGDKQEGQKATAHQPEGAVVQTKTKRKYNKKTAEERSRRSAAAMKRYQEELARVSSQSPTLMEPVATDAPKPVVDQAILDLAQALARILKVPGAV